MHNRNLLKRLIFLQSVLWHIFCFFFACFLQHLLSQSALRNSHKIYEKISKLFVHIFFITVQQRSSYTHSTFYWFILLSCAASLNSHFPRLRNYIPVCSSTHCLACGASTVILPRTFMDLIKIIDIFQSACVMSDGYWSSHAHTHIYIYIYLQIYMLIYIAYVCLYVLQHPLDCVDISNRFFAFAFFNELQI